MATELQVQTVSGPRVSPWPPSFERPSARSLCGRKPEREKPSDQEIDDALLAGLLVADVVRAFGSTPARVAFAKRCLLRNYPDLAFGLRHRSPGTSLVGSVRDARCCTTCDLRDDYKRKERRPMDHRCLWAEGHAGPHAFFRGCARPSPAADPQPIGPVPQEGIRRKGFAWESARVT